MMVTARYDTLVLGGGMAGLPLALGAARHGRVALVERGRLGGTCVNRGCIPTKTMIASATVAHQVRTAGAFGVQVGAPTVHLGAVVDRKDQIVAGIRSGFEGAVAKADQLDLYQAPARFVGPRRLRVGDSDLDADRIFLNPGTRPTIPQVDGLGQVPYLDSTSLLDLRELPSHLVVVGGGYVGCEYAQMFGRFGAQVTVIQRAERLLAAEEPEVSAAVAQGFAADGITVLAGTTCVGAAAADGGVRVWCQGSQPGELSGSHLLVAAGRTPNTDTFGLEHLDLEPNAAGFLAVDDHLHTSAEDVWALGDVRGGPMFTHTARDDADVVDRSAFGGQDRSIAGRVVPHAVFCDPEVGSVGLTEAQARAAGYQVLVGRQEFAGVAKARATGKTLGLVKFVVDAATDRILGCHIAGQDAGRSTSTHPRRGRQRRRRRGPPPPSGVTGRPAAKTVGGPLTAGAPPPPLNPGGGFLPRWAITRDSGVGFWFSS
jgi:pyruvate/2-oxoglutarate dehydrogenase complex dihydrolipoamide dehydrogenase (E3) component